MTYHCNLEREGFGDNEDFSLSYYRNSSFKIEEKIISDKSCVIVGLLHDLGKVGIPKKPKYIKNLQKNYPPYKFNNDLIYLSVPVRSLYLIGDKISLTEEEVQAIIYHDGQYVDESRFKIDEIGKMIGMSENIIKKFEQGEPIEKSKLVSQSYLIALNLIYNKKFGIISDDVSMIYSPIELIEIDLLFIRLRFSLGSS